jgi:pimeloyl-ACP methyl ester carboxylesterase
VRGIVMLDTGFACLRYLRIIHKWRGWKRSNRLLPEVNLEQFLSIDTKQDVTEFLKTMLDVPRVAGFMKGKSGLTPRQRKLLEQTSIGFEFRDVAGMTEELLSTLQTPVLALYGETSPYQKMASHLAKILPNCRQEVVPGAGHFSIFTPGMVTDRIMPFLRDPISYNRESAVKYQNDSTSSTLSRLLRKLFSGRLWKNLTDR